MVTQNYICYCV